MAGVYSPKLDPLFQGLKRPLGESTEMINASNFVAGFGVWNIFAKPLESRETKNGRQVVRGAPRKSWLVTDEKMQVQIGAAEADKVWHVTIDTLRGFKQGDIAPMNPNKRAAQQMLN